MTDHRQRVRFGQRWYSRTILGIEKLDETFVGTGRTVRVISRGTVKTGGRYLPVIRVVDGQKRYWTATPMSELRHLLVDAPVAKWTTEPRWSGHMRHMRGVLADGRILTVTQTRYRTGPRGHRRYVTSNQYAHVFQPSGEGPALGCVEFVDGQRSWDAPDVRAFVERFAAKLKDPQFNTQNQNSKESI